MEYETAPGPAVSEIPPYLLPAGQWALLKRSGDIKSSITPGTVGRRANEWMSHGGWAALWSLNVVGGSAAAVKSAVVKSPRPSCSLSLLGLEVFVLEGCRKSYCVFFLSYEKAMFHLLKQVRWGHLCQKLLTLNMAPLGIWIQTFRASSLYESFTILWFSWCPSLLDHSSCLCTNTRACLSSASRGFLHSQQHSVP